jgi:hypothetical protein
MEVTNHLVLPNQLGQFLSSVSSAGDTATSKRPITYFRQINFINLSPTSVRVIKTTTNAQSHSFTRTILKVAPNFSDLRYQECNFIPLTLAAVSAMHMIP